MQKKINKIKIALSIVLVFLGIMGMGQTTLPTLPAKTIQGWIFPGDPACNAHTEFKDGRKIDVLKVEYFHLCNNTDNGGGHEGNLVRVDLASVSGNPDWSNLCNGYSIANAAEIQNPSYSSARFITISGGTIGLTALLNSSTKQTNFNNTIISFLTNSANQNFTGVELDFECTPWSQNLWDDYTVFLNTFGASLHGINKLLIVDGPAVENNTGSIWRHSFFKNNPNIDYLCVMAYDNNRTNVGNAVAPNDWVSDITDYVIKKMSADPNNPNDPNNPQDVANIKKIIIGMPSYGYHVNQNDAIPYNDTKQFSSGIVGYDIVNNLRDANSFERYFYGPSNLTSSDPNHKKWYYQDAEGLSKKIELIRAKGIKHISVWHLGGNDWFNRFNVKLNNDIVDANFKLPNNLNTISTNWIDPDYASNYNLTNGATINQCASVNKNNISGNELILSGYNLGVPVDGTISSFEVAVIGHSDPASDQLKSTFSIELYNGTTYSSPQFFDIYSSHDVIKIINNGSWGLGWSGYNLDNNFKVKIKLISGESAFLNAVYVKANYTSTSCYGYTNGTIPFDMMFPGVNVKEITTPYSTIFGLEITAGKTLIVKSIYNVWTVNGPIIVKPGGKLIIDGGTITSYCEKYLWQGVIVEGDANYSQFDETHHGKVTVKNGGTIKNAICGIKTRCTSDANRGGGIVYADHANFINNQTSIKMQPFQNTSTNGHNFIDISHIWVCDFSVNDQYAQPSAYPFQQFIELNYINGIEIGGCLFKNNTSNLPANFRLSGLGIKSNESYFDIFNFQRSTEFHNLKYGISANAINITKRIQVRNALFNNNLHGIFLMNSANSWLTSNTFKIPERFEQVSNNLANTNSAYGMYLDHCTGYTLEGNSFDKIDPTTNNPSPNKAAYGLIINESGEADNLIYNNSFQNIEHAASQMQGKNRNIPTVSNPNPTPTGLQILCNDFALNKQDNLITYDPAITNASEIGIKKYQGSDAPTNSNQDKTKPAGNTFSKDGSNVLSDYCNNGLNFNYYHHMGNTSDLWVPEFYSLAPAINKFSTQAYYIKNEVCPGKALQTGLPEPYPYEPIQLNIIIQQKSVQLNTSKLIYSLWVDNGNTEGLRHDIKISTTWDAFELYNQLLLGSPKLSEEVLVDAIKREDVLTPLMLKLILLANPQSTRSDRVWEALNNRTNPLPEAWIDEIKQGLEVISPIENMQADISYYASERNTYMNLLKQCYLSDTTETGMQQYLSLLNNESDIESKYELVFAKISNQDYEGALSSLATIEGMIDAEKQPEETDRLAKMNHIIPVLNSVESGNKTWETIEQSEKDYLIELSENDRSIVGSIATAARMQFEPNFVYEEPIYMPGEIPLKMAKPKKLNNSIINESTLKISPNPAVDYIEVSYDITGVINGLKMLITDAMGKTVLEKELTAAKDQQIIVVKDFAKGNYICTIYNNGKPNQNTKFIKK